MYILSRHVFDNFSKMSTFKNVKIEILKCSWERFPHIQTSRYEEKLKIGKNQVWGAYLAKSAALLFALNNIKTLILDSPKGDYTDGKGRYFHRYIYTYIYIYIYIYIYTYIYIYISGSQLCPATRLEVIMYCPVRLLCPVARLGLPG